MSFIRRKYIHGNWYLYQVHSVRKGDKVIQVIDKYIGPEEPKRLEDKRERELKREIDAL